jgi:hypothetical protein
MSDVAVVWIVVALVSTAAVAAVLIGLVRHVIVLSRTLGRFQREVSPIAAEISAMGGRAARRSRRPARERRDGAPRGERTG